MENETKHKSIPVEFVIPPELISYYPNNYIIQDNGNDFVISFFEIFPPIVLGNPEEVEIQVNNIDKVQAKCIARLQFSNEHFQEFLKVMNDHFEKRQQASRG